MSNPQFLIKPLFLAITIASTHVYANECPQNYTINTQEEFDAALTEVVTCGSEHSPYKIEINDTLAGETLDVIGIRYIDGIELEIMGPENANTNLDLSVPSVDGEGNYIQNFFITNDGDLSLKNLNITGGNSRANSLNSGSIFYSHDGRLEFENINVQNYNSILSEMNIIDARQSDIILTNTFFNFDNLNLHTDIIKVESSNLTVDNTQFVRAASSANFVSSKAIESNSSIIEIKDSSFNGLSDTLIYASSSDVTINNSNFSQNTVLTPSNLIDSQFEGSLSISDSVFYENTVPNTKNIINFYTSNEDNKFSIHNSTFKNNESGTGTIYVSTDKENEIEIIDSIFEGNVSERADESTGNEIGISTPGRVLIDNSYFSGGYASSGDKTGLLFAWDSNAEIYIKNSTFNYAANSDNTDSKYSNIIVFVGKKIFIDNSTFVHQNIKAGDKILSIHSNNNTSMVNISNSILIGNIENSLCFYGDSTIMISNSFHDIENNSTCNVIYDDQSQVGTVESPLDPLLHPLANNGGNTLTFYPQANSPLIDAGDIYFTSNGLDQRGGQRVVNGRVDIGAVEYLGELPIRNETEYVDARINEFDDSNINLSVYFTSPDSAELNFIASDLPQGLSIQTDTGIISGSPTESGFFDITIEAKTRYDLSVSDTFRLTVLAMPFLADNDFSFILAEIGQTIEIDLNQHFLVSNDSKLNFVARGLPSGLIIDNDSGLISGTLTQNASGKHTVSIDVESIDGLTLTHEVEMTVSSQPEISGLEFIKPKLLENVTVNFDISDYFVSTDASELIFKSLDLPSGLAIDSQTGVIYGIAPEIGDYTFNIQAENEVGQTVNAEFTISFVAGPKLSAKPISDIKIEPQQNIYFDTSEYFSYSGPLNYTSEQLPQGLSLAADTGIVYGTSSEQGDVIFIVIAQNENGHSISQEFTFSFSDKIGTETITDTKTITDTETITDTKTITEIDTDSQTDEQTSTQIETKTDITTQTESQTDTTTLTESNADAPEIEDSKNNKKSGSVQIGWILMLLGMLGLTNLRGRKLKSEIH